MLADSADARIRFKDYETAARAEKLTLHPLLVRRENDKILKGTKPAQSAGRIRDDSFSSRARSRCLY
jgi:hypothetical protein